MRSRSDNGALGFGALVRLEVDQRLYVDERAVLVGGQRELLLLLLQLLQLRESGQPERLGLLHERELRYEQHEQHHEHVGEDRQQDLLAPRHRRFYRRRVEVTVLEVEDHEAPS